MLYESERKRHRAILTLPDSITLTQSQPYLWKVEARTGVDRWTSSDLIDFRNRRWAARESVAVIVAGPALVAAVLMAAPASRDSLALVAARLTDSALVVEVKRDPSAARDAITDLLASAVHGPASSRRDGIAVAQRVAAAFATAWRD